MNIEILTRYVTFYLNILWRWDSFTVKVFTFGLKIHKDAGFALYTQFGIFGKRFQTKVLGG